MLKELRPEAAWTALENVGPTSLHNWVCGSLCEGFQALSSLEGEREREVRAFLQMTPRIFPRPLPKGPNCLGLPIQPLISSILIKANSHRVPTFAWIQGPYSFRQKQKRLFDYLRWQPQQHHTSTLLMAFKVMRLQWLQERLYRAEEKSALLCFPLILGCDCQLGLKSCRVSSLGQILSALLLLLVTPENSLLSHACGNSDLVLSAFSSIALAATHKSVRLIYSPSSTLALLETE